MRKRTKSQRRDEKFRAYEQDYLKRIGNENPSGNQSDAKVLGMQKNKHNKDNDSKMDRKSRIKKWWSKWQAVFLAAYSTFLTLGVIIIILYLDINYKHTTELSTFYGVAVGAFITLLLFTVMLFFARTDVEMIKNRFDLIDTNLDSFLDMKSTQEQTNETLGKINTAMNRTNLALNKINSTLDAMKDEVKSMNAKLDRLR